MTKDEKVSCSNLLDDLKPIFKKHGIRMIKGGRIGVLPDGRGFAFGCEFEMEEDDDTGFLISMSDDCPEANMILHPDSPYTQYPIVYPTDNNVFCPTAEKASAV